jgi:hypothetical protein
MTRLSISCITSFSHVVRDPKGGSQPRSQNQGCHASGRPRQRPQDVRTRLTTPRTSAGRHGGRPSDRRTACRPPPHPADGMADGHPTAGRPLRPSAGWRTAAPSAGRGGGRPGGPLRQGPSSRGRPPEAVRPAKTLESHNY